MHATRPDTEQKECSEFWTDLPSLHEKCKPSRVYFSHRIPFSRAEKSTPSRIEKKGKRKAVGKTRGKQFFCRLCASLLPEKSGVPFFDRSLGGVRQPIHLSAQLRTNLYVPNLLRKESAR
jgi:hypothetical protein